MKSVQQMIDEIIEREGSRYTNDPKDRGGPTKFGLTLRYARGKGLLLDLDGDGDVDERDIMLLTPTEVARCYREDFLEHPRFNETPEQVQPQLFDMAVNHGPTGAARMFQEVLKDMIPDAFMAIDGRVGDKTLAVMWRAINRCGAVCLNNRLVDRRVQFFKAIVEKDPSQKKWLRGWLNRAESFRF